MKKEKLKSLDPWDRYLDPDHSCVMRHKFFVDVSVDIDEAQQVIDCLRRAIALAEHIESEKARREFISIQ